MNRYIAFLRAINVGGRTVRMEELRALFQALDVANVETFIASGNVIFDAAWKASRAWERKIERQLREGLGWDVATFLRSSAELRALAEHPAFPGERGDIYIAFTAAPLADAQRAAVAGLRTPSDDFHVNGREIYWLRRERGSPLSGYLVEKAIGVPATVRNMNTVQRLLAKVGA
ncbi:MAG TPA: DUF1697 domain-containing protein [Longimicrobiales bacterium]